MGYQGEVGELKDWQRIFQPMLQQLNGDDIRFTQLDTLWGQADEDPEQMDVWAHQDWLGPDPKVEKDPLRQLMLEQQKEAALGAPRQPHPQSVLSPQSDFNLQAWEASVKNGYIPQSALARVGETGFYMQAHAAAALWAMLEAARKDGVALSIGNTYRDYNTQVQMYQNHKAGRGALAADPGTSNHGFGLATDLNITPENHAWLVANSARFGFTNPFGNSYNAQENWHWEYGQNGNAPSFTGPGAADPMLKKPKAKVVTKPVENNVLTVPMMLSGQYGDAAFSTVLAEVLGGDEVTHTVKYKTPKQLGSGPNAGVKRQLYQGFMDAGRPDLARMVGTRDFATWINQESGWNPGVTSEANNHGMANDGLFQIWRGHDFNSSGQVSRMSPYEQAQIVVKYFQLSVADIRNYAAQIRAGSYQGWG